MAKADVGEIRSPVVVLLFGIVTCGIYWLYLEFQTAKEVNRFLGREEISPGLALFGALCCLPVTIYVEYLTVKALPAMQETAGMTVESQNIVVHLLLAVFLYPVEVMLLQHELNRVWRAAQ